MAPACRGGRRKAHCKQCLVRQPKTSLKPSQESPSTAANSSKLARPDMEEANSNDVVPLSGCSTPKAKRFRIPDHLPCPPAPKKRRLAALNCSSHRPSMPFFTPPDIELFFLIALQGVSG